MWPLQTTYTTLTLTRTKNDCDAHLLATLIPEKHLLKLNIVMMTAGSNLSLEISTIMKVQ